MTNDLHVESTRDLGGLFADAELWNGLAAGIPFRETSWLRPWWSAFAEGRDPYVLVARDGTGKVQGLLPLYRDRHRTLRNLGDGHACSDCTSVIAAAGNAVAAGAAIGQFLGQAGDGGSDEWDLLEIDGILENDPGMVALATSLRQAGASIHSHSRMSTWHLPCDESWDAYLSRATRKTRSRYRRLLKRCRPQGTLAFAVYERPNEIETAIRATIDLHQARWNEVGLPGAFASARFRQFITDAMGDFALRDRVRPATLTFEGRIIAGMINIIGGDRNLYVYNSGYDTSFSDLDPGIVLHTRLLRYAHDEGLAGIDYLRGDEPYKSRMKANPRRLLKLRAFAPAWRPRLRRAAWVTRFGLKQFVRKRIGRPLVQVVDLPTTSPAFETP